MKLKRFFGLTSRAVLEQVRSELGPDALIIANRSTAEGVEVDALAGDAVTLLTADDTPAKGRDAPVRAPARDADPAPLLTRAEAGASAPPRAPEPPAADAGLREVREDVAGLRALLETQLSQLAWTDTLRRNPQRAKLMRDLLTAGYSPALARELTQAIDGRADPSAAFDALTRTLASRLDCSQAVDDVVTRGGV
jgi:flagellar biosynthesis protein FlhF